MIFIKTILLVGIGFVSSVAAHGHIKFCTVNGKTYQNYNPWSWTRDTDKVFGWKVPLDTDNTYIDFKNINTPDIICHKSATPGDLHIPVKPGDVIKCQWTSWPISHHGNVYNYLANCNGDCTKVDKQALRFNKMTESCLIHPFPGIPVGHSLRTPGYPHNPRAGFWGCDQARDNNELVEFHVPSSIAKGDYILRQEKVGLHSAMDGASGAQPIPQCIQFRVEESSGNDAFMTGTLGTELYNKNEPGFHLDIFLNPGSYLCPGPPLYKGQGSDVQSGGDKSTGHVQSADHKSAGHKSTGHSSNSHESTGHQSSGHKSDGHQSSSHKSNGHKSNSHKSDGHKSSSHKPSSHKSPHPKPIVHHNPPNNHPTQYPPKKHTSSGNPIAAHYVSAKGHTAHTSHTIPHDLTKLSVHDLETLLRKIITALKSRFARYRHHA